MTELSTDLPAPVEAFVPPALCLKTAVEHIPHGQVAVLQDDQQAITLSYEQLWQQSNRVVAGLRHQALQPGQVVILLFDDALELISAFWGCIMGGFVALPLQLPSNAHVSTHPKFQQILTKLDIVLDILESPVLLTSQALAATTGLQSEIGHQVNLLYWELAVARASQAVESRAPFAEPQAELYRAPASSLAALFLSSGTTGRPKLVSFNAQAISQRLGGEQANLDVETRFLYWLPLDHASALLRIAAPDALFKYFLPTEQFLKKPLLWLDAIGRYQITQSSLTNFAMSLITRALQRNRMEQISTSNLSESWRLDSLELLGIGAEPIVPDVYQQFFETLATFGLKPDIAGVGYGLTECGTICGERNPKIVEKDGRRYVSLGVPHSGYTVRIVNDLGDVLPENAIGQVYIQGPVTAVGYYRNEDATRSLFTGDGWMKTGDLGFMHEGRLVITGRQKDILIINANNYACQHIEQIVETVPGVEPAYTGACSIAPHTADDSTNHDSANHDSNSEAIAIFFHPVASGPTPSDAPIGYDTLSTCQAIRRALVNEIGVNPSYVIPLPKTAIPRTAAGKLQRSRLKKQFEAGKFDAIVDQLGALFQQSRRERYQAPQTPTEQKLANIWADVLSIDRVSLDDNFFDLGGDSLLSARLVNEIERQLGRQLPLSALFQLGTVADLGRILDQEALADTSLQKPAIPSAPLSQKLDAEIHRKLFAYTAGWEGTRVRPDSLVVGINTQGDKQPIFWCCQGYRELSQLATYMGMTQPTYGMRSGHLVMEYTAKNVDDLAAHYVEEIIAVQPESPYILGGNCQSTRIITKMAKQLQMRGKTVTLLCLLDGSQPEFYAGKVALFFGRSSQFNPYRCYASPEVGWRKIYPSGFSVDLLPCGHGQYFKEPNVQMLTKTLTQRISQAQLETAPLADETSYQSQIITQPKITCEAGRKVTISVSVKNLSPVTWAATDKSGIRLANHWLDDNGEVVQWLDASAPFSDALPSSSTRHLVLEVNSPQKPGNYQLELDLVEEGITWFSQKGMQTVVVDVEVTEESIEETIEQSEPPASEFDQHKNVSSQIAVVFAQGQFQVVVNLAQKHLEATLSPSLDLLKKLAASYYALGQHESALSVYQRAYENHPKSAEIVLKVGQIQLEQQSFKEAADSFQAALNLGIEDLVSTYEGLGLSLEKQQRVRDAIATYQTLLKHCPNHLQTIQKLAKLLFQSQDYKAALGYYQQAAKLSPDQLFGVMGIGNSLIALNQIDQALKTYQQALDLHPIHPSILHKIGMLWTKKGCFEEAEIALQKMVKASPESVQAQVSLGNLYLNQWQQVTQAETKAGTKAETKAEHHFRQALVLDPTHYIAQKHLAIAIMRQDRLDEALTILKSVQSDYPNNPDLYPVIGHCYTKAAMWQKAIESYRQAIALNIPNLFGVYRSLGMAFSQLQQYEKAVEAYQNALDTEHIHQQPKQQIDHIKRQITVAQTKLSASRATIG